MLTPPVPPRANSDIETIAASSSAGFAATGGMTTRLVPGQTFGQRYQIISLLGSGGMGAVYHVWDSELALSLALKVIRPESDPFEAQELERRFKRELVLARQVTHTNVIRIHDLGEIDGVKYLTMPFVHGTDLARLLAAEGKLAVPRVVAIARQIVSGLRAAHEVGVVHRDLKPANILIEDGEKAVITDFGIARSVDAATFATAAGAIIGTLAYMSPEQASGRPADQRSDIYSLGLILYEMLVGKRGMGRGDTALAMLIERSRQAPPALRTIDPTIPEALERLVAKCLDPDPTARYQTSKELEAAFERLDGNGHEHVAPPPVVEQPQKRTPTAAIIVAAAIVVAALAWIVVGRRATTPPPPPVARAPVSVLIADFDNQAKDPVFQGSLEQALNIAIEGASFVTTYPRSSAQTLLAQLKPGTTLDGSAARLVAEREGIKFVLTGTVAPGSRGSGYDITVKAVDPANGNVMSTATASVANKASVLQGVETVASKLRDALGDTTPESARRAQGETVTTISLEALQEYSIAQDLSSSGKQLDSIEHYKKATELDPRFGRAYSGWATALYNLGRRDEAANLWKQSLSLMELMTEREKYRTLGLWFNANGSYEQAKENFEKLVAQYPADRAGQSNLAFAYFQMLNFPKALEHGKHAVELYPKNPRTRQNLALYAMYAGDLKTAEQEARTTIEQNKAQYKAYLPLVAVAFSASNIEGMRTAYEAMRSSGPAGASLAAHGLADILMYEGRWDEAEKLLTDGIAADDQAKNRLAKAAKLIALSETYLAQSRAPQAVKAAQDAMALTTEDSTTVPAALVFVHAGRRAEALEIAKGLAQQFPRRSRAYAAIIEGEAARANRQFIAAKEAFERAQQLSDLWLTRFLLGGTYVEAQQYATAQAEIDASAKRWGEATAVFLDDVPSYRHLAPLSYWTGRAQEGMNSGSASAADNYRKFLALRPDAARDALASDARKRLQVLPAAASPSGR